MKEVAKVNKSVRFSAKTLTISDLLRKDTRNYEIPEFQRPYQWTDTQVSTLVNDLLDFFSNKNFHEFHYSLGSIICEYKNGYYDILDGQQRLTTLDIVLDVVSHCCPR